ncbi:class F sortase [Streptomyces kunmingensis]|uniref:Class F sortase n=1 Tax=Streptomyces kunmingensis TaxID=68225 RepID=A0ABU6CDE2_9ACTN|nr:class F sortase [Streptomyces kunmingensis]MEB3962713.1 class F sortase [Streptomyces kunmingensis]
MTAAACALIALSLVFDWLAGSGPAHWPDNSSSKQTRQAHPVASRTPSSPAALSPEDSGPRVLPPPVSHAADPVRLRIAALHLDTAIGPLSLDSEGRLPAPADYTDVGWWREGPSPGEAGPAVIAGHLDTVSGPAVFANLTGLRPGDRVEITRADQSRAVFEVRGAAEYPQDDFPTDAVYGSTPDAQLRLITCGGAYDRAAGRYLANTVVSATMVTP